MRGEPGFAPGGRGSPLVWVELGDDAGRIALELVGGDDAEAGLGAEHDDGDHQGLREAVSVEVIRLSSPPRIGKRDRIFSLI